VFWVDDLRRLEEKRTRYQAATNIATAGIHPDAKLDQTASVQRLLDRHGEIYFPAGVYRTGTLHVGSDTTLFFAPGALLMALDADEAVGAEFIALDNTHNVKFCGPGTIDAHSTGGRRGHNVHNVNVTGSRQVEFEDVCFEGSNSWGVHVRKSEQFTARNVKVLSGKDGFDPDSSRDVLIDRAFVVSGDDAIAVKNRYPREAGGGTTERVVFRNSIVSSTKSALKVGTETRGPIRDVRFEDCDVFDGERGVVLYARDGGPIERVVWRNLRLYMKHWPQEKESGAVFHLTIERRDGATPVRECLIENVSANWIYRSQFAGLPDAPLDGVTLRHITAKVEAPKAGKPFLFECVAHVRVPLEDFKIDWQGNEANWGGVVKGDGLVITGNR
jgi:hypothetical protein